MFIALFALIVFCSFSRSLVAAPAPEHDRFRVAVYIPVFVVQKMKDPAYLQKSWDDLSSQVKVDKVYIETYRSGTIADDAQPRTGQSLLRLPQRADRRRDRLRRPRRYSRRRRTRRRWRPVRLNVLHRPQTARIRQTHRRDHRSPLRRNHSRRLLLQQHQVRFRHRRERQSDLGRIPTQAHG